MIPFGSAELCFCSQHNHLHKALSTSKYVGCGYMTLLTSPSCWQMYQNHVVPQLVSVVENKGSVKGQEILNVVGEKSQQSRYMIVPCSCL